MHWTTFRSTALGPEWDPISPSFLYVRLYGKSPAVKTTQLEAEPVCSCLMTRGIQAKNLNSVLHPCFKHQFLMAACLAQTNKIVHCALYNTHSSPVNLIIILRTLSSISFKSSAILSYLSSQISYTTFITQTQSFQLTRGDEDEAQWTL